MNKLIAFLLLIGTIPFANAQKVPFYSDTICFSVSCKKPPLFLGKIEEKKELLTYYENLNNCKFLIEFSNQLAKYKNEYQINDFYIAQIVESYCLVLDSKVTTKQQKVLMYCIFKYIGYDVRLAYSNNIFFVLGVINTELYSRSYILIKNKKYYSLHKHDYKGSFSNSIDYIVSNKNKVFDFSIVTVPVLQNPYFIEKKVGIYQSYNVYYDDKSESFLKGKIKEVRNDTNYLNIRFNKSLIDLYDDLPIIESSKYFYLSLTDTLRKQILHHLNFSGLETKQDTLKYLIKFVRSIGEYKTDMEAYKRERPMFPEEALYYNYTDCEDRNALLFCLVKEILNLPMIILEYPDHINIAVAIEGEYKQFVTHKGYNYFICEASSGSNVVEIGTSYIFSKYPVPKIIGEYCPNKPNKY